MTKIIADQPTDATSDAPGPEFLPLQGLPGQPIRWRVRS